MSSMTYVGKGSTGKTIRFMKLHNVEVKIVAEPGTQKLLPQLTLTEFSLNGNENSFVVEFLDSGDADWRVMLFTLHQEIGDLLDKMDELDTKRFNEMVVEKETLGEEREV